MISIVSLDANTIIRFLAADHPLHFQKAKQLLAQAEAGKIKLYLDPIIIAEVVWTFTSRFDFPKSKISELLTILVSNPWVITRKKLVLKALYLFSQKNVDFVDAWLFVVSQRKYYQIATFDKDFDKLDKSIRYPI